VLLPLLDRVDDAHTTRHNVVSLFRPDCWMILVLGADVKLPLSIKVPMPPALRLVMDEIVARSAGLLQPALRRPQDPLGA